LESLALLPKQVDDEGYVVKDNVALSSFKLDGGWDSHAGCSQRVSRCDAGDCNFKVLILYHGEHAC
jgi:hypothetical protein